MISSAKRDFAGVMSPLVLGKGEGGSSGWAKFFYQAHPACLIVCEPGGQALEEADKKIILTAGICHWVSLEAYLMPNFIQLAQLCMQRMKTEKSC